MEGPIVGPSGGPYLRALLEVPMGGPHWSSLWEGPIGGTYWRDLLEGPIGGPHGGPSCRALLEGPIGEPHGRALLERPIGGPHWRALLKICKHASERALFVEPAIVGISTSSSECPSAVCKPLILEEGLSPGWMGYQAASRRFARQYLAQAYLWTIHCDDSET